MELSKIKNITIAALLLVDIILAFLIVRVLLVNSNREKAALEHLRQICAQREIELDIDELPSVDEMEVVAASRTENMETAFANAVVGSGTLTNEGGGIRVYSSSRGTGIFRSSGDFELTVSDEREYKNAETAAKNIMKSAGVDIFSINSGGNGVVSVVCAYEGRCEFNCVIDFEFEGNVLKTVKGKLPFEVKSAVLTDILDSKTALVCLLNYIKENDIQCRSINSVECGYIFAADVFGGGEIIPVWSIDSAGQRYYINACTGQIENQGF